MALLERSQSFTVASVLATRATTDPEGVYLRTDAGDLTFGEVDGQAEALAAALSNLGVERGDRIALVLPACPEFVVSLFAAAKLGAVIVPLNPRLTDSELQYMLRHSAAVCAITIEEAYGVDYLQLFEDLVGGLPDLRYLVTVGEEELWYDDRIFQYEDLVSAGGGRDYPAPELDPGDDPFAIVYTSGTMGKPKGVELSHRNLVSAAAGTADVLGLEPDDRVAGLTALFHVFGLAPGVLAPALAGSSVILQLESDPQATLAAAADHRATIIYGVPTHFVAELRILREGSVAPDLSSLRLALLAGAPVSDELVTRVEEVFGVDALTAYSLTETASTVAATSTDHTAEQRKFTVGLPLPGTEVRIFESDGREVPVESVGEIGVRGPGVMLGYYRQPGETRDAFDEDGFFRTGDLGLLDEEGLLHLVGRSKDVIIRSGFNVYPREVETRVESHPAVQEVAVIGIPDPLLGEAICACVVPVEGAVVTGSEIVDWCRETLAEDKVPDSVRFIDALPRTDNGKVRRVELSRVVQSESESA